MTFRQVDDVIRGFVLSDYPNALSKLGKQQKNVMWSEAQWNKTVSYRCVSYPYITPWHK